MFDAMASCIHNSKYLAPGTYHESQGPGCCRIDSTRDWGVDEDSTHHCTLIRQLLADCRIYSAAVYQQGAGLVGAEDTI